MPANVIQIPSLSYGYAGLNNKVPTSGVTGRVGYPSPLGIFISCAGDDAEGMIIRAQADPTYNPPANAPRVGIPHFNVAANGTAYQFVQLGNAAWAMESTPVNATSGVVTGQGTVNPNLYGIFITYESSAISGVPIIGSPQGALVPNAPTPVQVAAIADLVRLIRATYPSLPLITYRAANTRYICPSAAQLITDVTALLAEPVPPDCNADLCLYDDDDPAPEDGMLVVYDPDTRCALGLMPLSAVVPPEAESISLVNFGVNGNSGLTSGVASPYATMSVANPSSTQPLNLLLSYSSQIGGTFDAEAGARQISILANFDADVGSGWQSVGSATGQSAINTASAYHANTNENDPDNVGYIGTSVNQHVVLQVPAGETFQFRVRATPFGLGGALATLTLINQVSVIGVLEA